MRAIFDAFFHISQFYSLRYMQNTEPNYNVSLIKNVPINIFLTFDFFLVMVKISDVQLLLPLNIS